jgi:hypothetical protein
MLPCGNSICGEHVTANAKKHHCYVCDLVHDMPNDGRGFPRILALESMLDAKIQHAKFCSKYEAAFNAFKALEANFQALKFLHQDPDFFINQAIGELKKETDLLREEFKLQIDEQANAIIKELDEYEQKCKKYQQVKLEIDKNVRRLSDQLPEWKKHVTSFDSGETKWSQVKEACELETDTIEANLDNYKEALLLHKLHEYQSIVVDFSKSQLNSNRE